MSNALPSGQWTGYYRYGWLFLKRKDTMQLTLSFENGLIQGHGSDPVGSFTILGRYELDYEFTKQYSGRHSVIYKGRPKGSGLAGRWHIPNDWSGEFEIWPTGDGPTAIDLLGLPSP